MTADVIYVVQEFPCLTETFIARELQALEAHGVRASVVPLCTVGLLPAFRASVHHWRRLPRLYRRLRSNPLPLQRHTAVHALILGAWLASHLGPRRHIHSAFMGFPAVVAWVAAQLQHTGYSISGHARDVYVARTPPCVMQEAAFRTVCNHAAQRYLNDRYPNDAVSLIRHELPELTARADRTRAVGRPLQILAIGRLVEKKGFEHLIEASAMLRDHGVDFRCTILGEGPERRCLDEAIQRLGLRSHVALRGAVPHSDVKAHLHRADVLVAPSVIARDGDRDGVPNALLEAIQAGVPAIATDVGGIPEVAEGLATIIVQKNPARICEELERIAQGEYDINQSVSLASRYTSGVNDLVEHFAKVRRVAEHEL